MLTCTVQLYTWIFEFFIYAYCTVHVPSKVHSLYIHFVLQSKLQYLRRRCFAWTLFAHWLINVVMSKQTFWSSNDVTTVIPQRGRQAHRRLYSSCPVGKSNRNNDIEQPLPPCHERIVRPTCVRGEAAPKVFFLIFLFFFFVSQLFLHLFYLHLFNLHLLYQSWGTSPQCFWWKN